MSTRHLRFVCIFVSLLAACGTSSGEEPADPLSRGSQALGAPFRDNALSDVTTPSPSSGFDDAARDYTLFEVDPVRPVAVFERSSLLAVLNTVDDRLELFHRRHSGRVSQCGQLKVGMRPVAVAIVRETSRRAELWVTNHISDSISVVHVDPRQCHAELVDTLHVGDEPRDIVVARTGRRERRVFVATAHRGQHHPLASARSGEDLVLSASEKAHPGLADVLVFDPKHRHRTPEVVNLFTDVPRALAVGDGVVYAAGFRTGNQSTVIGADVAARAGREALLQLLQRDANGELLSVEGQLQLKSPGAEEARMRGGVPAVSGQGRCVADPRAGRRQDVLELCVRTDSEHRALALVPQLPGQSTPECQCTNGAGEIQPNTSVIVQFFQGDAACGAALSHFQDGGEGCWLDASPSGTETPAHHASQTSPPLAWNDEVRFSLPDADVFAIDAKSLEVRQAFSNVGTILFGMAVHPQSGDLFVANTEAKNLTRFEGRAENASTTTMGHLHESRISVIRPRTGSVTPVHLNDHIDYSQCCERTGRENELSFAFPTMGAFSPNGRDYYFTALGSNKIGRVRAQALDAGFRQAELRERGWLSELSFGGDLEAPAGPVGLAVDPASGVVYVKTHFSNELIVVHPRKGSVKQRVVLPTPEPERVTKGRHVLYNARLTSSHGDSACASCHVFGDFDGIGWDLGDPDGRTVVNPGPFAAPPEMAVAELLADDPNGEVPANRPQDANFRSNKGPMSTQTLRGLANHGAMHWRGDRTRNFQAPTGQQPDFGSLDENNSFGEFDVAITGLNGNDQPLPPAVFQQFTDFALQLTLPPNPVRPLDNVLDAGMQRARATYFGCASLTEEQWQARTCTAHDGSVVDIDAATRDCACSNNPMIELLRELSPARPLLQALGALAADAEASWAVVAQAGAPAELPAAQLQELQLLAEKLGSALGRLAEVSLELESGLFGLDAAEALASVVQALTDVVELHQAHESSGAQALLQVLSEQLAVATGGEITVPPEGLAESAEPARLLANLTLVVQRDEAKRGELGFRDLLSGCSVLGEPSCALRVTDGLHTCHGCHTLDPQGNAEFGVEEPGFFGTSGAYSFENVEQIFKVPHLRNAYQKTGMLGVARRDGLLPEHLLGTRKGGFFAPENAFAGRQVRGFGFFHDGSVDTVHRFLGGRVFVRTPSNPGGFDPSFPVAELQGQCVELFRSAPPQALELVPDPASRPVLELCLRSGPLPDSCFVSAGDPQCQQALAEVGAQLGIEQLPQLFETNLLPACFSLGSAMEEGAIEGVCFPERQRTRIDMERFVMAFDTNLAPMVGQQVTVAWPRRHSARSARHASSALPELLSQMLRADERDQCHLAARIGGRGYLVVNANAGEPLQTLLRDRRGGTLTLAELRQRRRPITFTCYPPQAQRAEAARSAFDRADSCD